MPSHPQPSRGTQAKPALGGGPRYVEIEAWLRGRCETLSPGSALPSETEVAEQFGVSRMTARHAFKQLVQRGLIEQRRGAGSFVRPPQLHREEALLRSFSDEMRSRGIEPSSRQVRGEVTRDADQAAALGLSKNASVVVIERVRLADSVPVALERAVLPGEFAPVLDADLEAGSLHEALAELGRELGRASGHITARLATAEEARLLDVTRPAVLLVETRLVSDRLGRVVESTETAYVADRWVIDTGSFVAPARRHHRP